MYVSLARCLILDFSMAAKPVLLIFRRRRRSSSCCVSVLNSCAASSCSSTSLTMASYSRVSPTFSLRHRLRPLATRANFVCNRLMGKEECTGLLQTFHQVPETIHLRPKNFRSGRSGCGSAQVLPVGVAGCDRTWEKAKSGESMSGRLIPNLGCKTICRFLLTSDCLARCSKWNDVRWGLSLLGSGRRWPLWRRPWGDGLDWSCFCLLPGRWD